MFRMFLRATLMTTLMMTIGTVMLYLVSNVSQFSLASFALAIGLSAAFAIYVTASTELCNSLFQRFRKPSLGIVCLMLIGVLAYLVVSRTLGAPLFSDSIKNGLVGCVFFNAFAGCVLYLGYRENNSAAFYAFGGMVSGFMFQPFMATLGLAAEPNLNLALAGALVGSWVGLIYRFQFIQELKYEIYKIIFRRI